MRYEGITPWEQAAVWAAWRERRSTLQAPGSASASAAPREPPSACAWPRPGAAACSLDPAVEKQIICGQACVRSPLHTTVLHLSPG